MSTTTETAVTPRVADITRITPLHLSISHRPVGGQEENVHLVENGDLGVILSRGQADHEQQVPFENVRATFVVSIGVDDDHDEVQFQTMSAFQSLSAISKAIETLMVCRDALYQVRCLPDGQ